MGVIVDGELCGCLNGHCKDPCLNNCSVYDLNVCWNIELQLWFDFAQVLAAGDMCAICQEKMHAPIALRCNHIFCEDCVSEWWVLCSKMCSILVIFAFLMTMSQSMVTLSWRIDLVEWFGLIILWVIWESGYQLFTFSTYDHCGRFERERTCPLCRAVVRSVGLRSYGDGSTSLLIQLFWGSM